tara:strand:+ start:4064 stop:4975 length:912 start_codon:yes stop_codon:yes gene_type:complete
MKYLITGGCGFIGSNLVDKLTSLGHDVLVIDNLSTGKKENCNSLATYIFKDYQKTLKDSLFTISDPLCENIDVIFHLAAMPRIQPSFDNPLYTMSNNAHGTAILCEFARKKNSKVVYAGSSSFYGGVYLNPYSFSKWVGEEICKMYSQIYEVPTSIARFFNVFGPRHLRTGPYSTVVGVFEKQFSDGLPLTITGDGDQRRDFTHVDDICNGLIAMSEGTYYGEIFNLGTAKNYSINELASMYDGAKTEFIAARPGEARETLADISYTRSALNWSPLEQNSLKDYIAQFVESLNPERELTIDNL